MVRLVFDLEFSSIGMQREERKGRRRLSTELKKLQGELETRVKRKMREKRALIQMVLVGPIAPKLAMFKTLICGPRMKTTKKTKMIAEKSSFQKV